MRKSPEQERPDVAVADQIVTRLRDGGILPPAFAQRVATQLASGSINATEWRRLAEQVLAWEMQASTVEAGDHES